MVAPPREWTHMSRYASHLSRSYPYLAVTSFVLTAFFPDALNAGIVTAGGLVLGGALCVAGVLASPPKASRSAIVAAGAMTLAALWFGIASLWSANPAVAFFGLTGQHNGAAMWLLAAVWILAGLVCADTRALRRTLATVSGSGVFFAAALLMETLTYGAERMQGFAAGLFDNSSSAGTLFAVAILASVTGAVIARDRRVRLAYGGSGLFTAAALYLSSSRTGFLGVGAAVVFAVLISRLSERRPSSAVLGSIPSALSLGASIAWLAGSEGLLGTGFRHAISTLGTERDVIWRAVTPQLAQAPVLGSGLEHFSAVTRWSIGPGQLSGATTADPHNIVMAAALGGGALGLLLLLVAFAALTAEGVRTARRSNRSLGVALLASAPMAVLAVGAVGWIAPAAILAFASLVGAGLGAAKRRGDGPRPGTPVLRILAVSVGVASVLGGTALLPVIAVQQRYVTGIASQTAPLTASEARELYGRHPDPSIATYALAVLNPAVQAGDAQAEEQARELLRIAERDASWSVVLAESSLRVSQALERDDASLFPQFEAFVQRAATADPQTGLWYSFAALEANRLGLTDLASTYAQRALEHPMDDASNAYVRSLLEQ